MELQQLRYFVAVAETGNFTRASERCHVAQPSLSQQIINLEKELGHKLFHGLGRKAVPTEAGLAFLARSRRILLEVDDTFRELKDSSSFERSITIGAIPTLAPSLIPPLIALAAKRLPQLSIQVHEDFHEKLVEDVGGGVLDLAILAVPVRDPSLSVETVFSEPLLVVVGKKHALASKSRISVDDIKKERFVMMGSGSTLAQEIHRFCGENDFQPNIVATCAQVATVKTLVAAGFGISILPQGVITWEDRASLISHSLSGRSPTREIAVARHPLRYQTKGAELFLGILREHTKQAPARITSR